MASSSRGNGRGNIPRGRSRGRILSPYISIDEDGLTLVATKSYTKRGRYIGSSSSSQSQQNSKENVSKETLANIVGKEDSDYISKNFSLYVCYIE